MAYVLEFHDKAVNFEALNENLSSLLGDFFLGISTADNTLWVSMSEETPDDLREQAAQMVADHNPDQLSDHQMEQQQMRERLLTLRESVASHKWTDEDTEALTEPQRTMMLKLEWLELELRYLRGEF